MAKEYLVSKDCVSQIDLFLRKFGKNKLLAQKDIGSKIILNLYVWEQ